MTHYSNRSFSQVVTVHRANYPFQEKMAMLQTLLGENQSAIEAILRPAWRPRSFFDRLPYRDCRELLP